MTQSDPAPIAILGSSGYLGTNYRKHLHRLRIPFFPIYHNQSKTEIEKLIIRNAPEYIVNLAATHPNETFEKSLFGNFEYPMHVLRSAKKVLGNNFKWIQVGSYWEFQVQLGRNSPYALHKYEFRQAIQEMSEVDFLKSTSLILPHIVRGGEDVKRLSNQLSNAKKTQTVIKLSTGTQYLPVLHVSDAVGAVTLSLRTDQTLCSAPPVYYESVMDYAKLILGTDFEYLIEVDLNKKSVDADFAKLIFPEKVLGFKPKIGIEVILNELRKDRE
jgi:nucleoside-diphosphate-sugar epimerase